MHSKIFAAFDAVVAPLANEIHSVLEVGATPSPDTLLNLPALRHTRERVGVNLASATKYDGFSILSENANSMPSVPTGHFDLVVCNAVLEHDPRFWLSLAEMKRVLRDDGLLIIGVPGYRRLRAEHIKSHIWRVLHKLRASRRITSLCDPLLNVTATFEVHNHPGDYYRFSEQAVQEVFLSGMRHTKVTSLLFPPRIVGLGRKVNSRSA